MQPLPILSSIWEDLSLDFIIGLPPSNDFTAILVVVDRYSKEPTLVCYPLTTLPTRLLSLFWIWYANSTVSLGVWFLTGTPSLSVHSGFWRDLFQLSGTKLRMSTAYHPQMDGQTEVLNRVLEQYLRSFLHDKLTQWHQPEGKHIGPIAYHLKLPDTSKIHLVFHISLLKLHHGPLPEFPNSLPHMSSDNHPIVGPLQILQWKWDSSMDPPTKLVLVQWIGLAP